MCPTLPEIAACTARKIRLLRRQCALHGCKGFLPRTGVMSGTSAKCTFHIRQRWGSPNGEMKDTNLEVWRWKLRATPRLPLRRKSRKATSMCPTLPEIAACTARKIRLLRRQCALHGCKGFLPRTGVMSGTSAKCTFHIRQRWGSPNGEMKDTNLEVWRWTLRATATSMCPTLPEIAACTARKIRLLRRQCALHGLDSVSILVWYFDPREFSFLLKLVSFNTSHGGGAWRCKQDLVKVAKVSRLMVAQLVWNTLEEMNYG